MDKTQINAIEVEIDRFLAVKVMGWGIGLDHGHPVWIGSESLGHVPLVVAEDKQDEELGLTAYRLGFWEPSRNPAQAALAFVKRAMGHHEWAMKSLPLSNDIIRSMKRTSDSAEVSALYLKLQRWANPHLTDDQIEMFAI